MRGGGLCARRGVPAFTLVEALVVISIITILLALLIPSLRKARGYARSVRCGTNQRGFSTGLHTYFSEHDEWIPGRNTSGLSIWMAGTQTCLNSDIMSMSRPYLPVQTYDWLSPILSTSSRLPAHRAKRFRLLLEEYRCPSVSYKALAYADRPDDHVQSPDDKIFEDEIEANGAFNAVSYLMPAHFQYWGYREPETYLGTCKLPGTNLVYKRFYIKKVPGPTPLGRAWEVTIGKYRSKLPKVGNPSEKIAVADGTRYMRAEDYLDFDHHYNPSNFGAFSSSGAWWSGSTAYGDQSPSGGKNIPISFRHGGGIRALFFDGHVSHLSRKQTHRVDYWYPRGAVVLKEAEGYSDFQQYPRGYVIR